jgi:hypothetical protein
VGVRLDLRRGNGNVGSARVVAVIVVVVVLAVSATVIALSAGHGGTNNVRNTAQDVVPGLVPGSTTSTTDCVGAHCKGRKRAGKKSSTTTSTTSAPHASGKQATRPKSAASHPSSEAGSPAPGGPGAPPPTGPVSSVNYQCGTDPNFSSPAYRDNKIVNSNGFNTYVQNNMWGAQPGTIGRICAHSPGNWYLDTSTQRDDGGAVQTYPQIQQLFGGFCNGTWNTCSNGADSTPLSRLTKLTSSYAEQTPSTANGTGTWEVAYDIWLDNTPHTEIMVWLVTSAERGTGGATVVTPNVSIGGQNFKYQVYGGSLPQLVLTTNQPNATIDLLAVLRFLQGQQLGGAPVVSAGATLTQLDFGIEICDTHGQNLHFSTSDYRIAAAAN